MSGRSARDHTGKAERQDRSPAEWITLGFGVAVIAALVVLVTYLYVVSGSNLPVIVATPLTAEIRQDGDLYYLPVAVRNDGDRTAEDVIIQGELVAGGTTQSGEFILDFLAGGETRRGTLIFSRNPADSPLTVRATSFR